MLLSDTSHLLERLTSIGLDLSREDNISNLLEKILTSARKLCHAEAGTLYLLKEDENALNFEIIQNEPMNISLRRDVDRMDMFSPVPMQKKGRPNTENVSSYVAVSGEKVNIEDVYIAEGFDFTGTRNYDQKSGYRSRSMLVIPMRNHEQRIIGVLQLINARSPDTGKVRAFSSEEENLIEAMASQAAVVLTKKQLIYDLENLFNAFIQSIATAVDGKSPHTGRHVERVVTLSLALAREISRSGEGPLSDVDFTEDELEELRLASWLHDVGKIATPEHILDKRTRLESIWDREELIRTRFSLIAQALENNMLKQAADSKPEETGADSLKQQLKELEEDLGFILECNRPEKFVSDKDMSRLQSIAAKEYMVQGQNLACLTSEELVFLSVQKGTLTREERHAIEDHARATRKILAELPFPRKMRRVPEYAAMHHERPDGSGYPDGISGKTLPLQARIIAVADVFEALTARDRPYKKPMPMSRALEILQFMKKDGHLDPDIVDLFVENKVYEKTVPGSLEKSNNSDLHSR